MNVLSRPLVAVACSLLVLLAAMPVSAQQRFLPQDIVEADPVTPEMRATIDQVVAVSMSELNSKEASPQAVTEARKQLLSHFRKAQPTVAYLEAVSASITAQMVQGKTLEKESTLVRINAAIVLASMVDSGSKELIDQALADEHDAVKNWAMTALGRRMLWWKAREAAGDRDATANIASAIEQTQTMMEQDQPPHPIVVRAAFDALVQANTAESREALISILNQRVTLHAADANLSYIAEQAAMERFTNLLVSEARPDIRTIRSYAQAMYRHASSIVAQAQAGSIAEEQQENANAMLFLCLQGLANVSATAKATVPANHAQVNGWIPNGEWENLSQLINNGWSAILTTDPFSLSEEDLAVK